MDYITLILNTIATFYSGMFFTIVGGIMTTVSVLILLAGMVSWALGIAPVVFRLGVGLWGRKIAIFGDLESYQSLRTSLVDSNIFKSKNIIHIEKINVDKAKDQTLFLVDWGSFEKQIEQVFSARSNHQTAIIIYAEPGCIDKDIMKDIANRPNTVVVNFRGRLLNDILISLVTTSYDR